ncbi:hypothetical protein N7491_010330 [Penicillium cf. griseofulvum]|uniref:Uncharacterized protein n=1 Tax=Penicillium cf. griseofulvum TaxID=2972120 RepID=A0A9W9MZP2_9EURO|nr:hypothetical protein N7472_000662 [Penicillium cf. griseofulvum]KAJ5421885.1 hypothetical protein N7491_010330 [Penicillium cf. griseofulvum]KAJ5428076.1 hypothetical protein N7445_009530 [Penicillium cf. griseofulvum]
MFFSPFTTLFVLLLSFQAKGASIGIRSMWIPEPENTLEATTQTILQSQPIHNAPSETALYPRDKHDDRHSIPGLRETTIDWREDGSESLRLESEREAGFLPGSSHER